MRTEKIVFGGGCFWCTEAVFKGLRGVLSVMPGYTGGHVEHPTYAQVCSGETGHAAAVEITYDPEQIQLRDLLTVFFATHDATQLNRQGNDVGTQYRSSIFYTTDEQKQASDAFIAELEASAAGDPIVTTVEPLTVFYEAEDYHRDYYARNQVAPYCQVIIAPKLQKVQQQFVDLLAKP